MGSASEAIANFDKLFAQPRCHIPETLQRSNSRHTRFRLRSGVLVTQGHKSRANAAYADEFVRWIEHQGFKRNRLLGTPQLLRQVIRDTAACGACDLHEDENDHITRE